ncbi:MAG: sulfotransferase [Lentisphaeria bacterium]
MSNEAPDNQNSDTIHRYLKPLLIITIVAVFIGAWLAGCEAYIKQPQKMVDTVTGGGWQAGVVFCFVFIAAGSLGVPPAVFVVAAGLLWPFWTALGFSLLGGMAAAIFGYLLSRYIAHDFCQRHIPKGVQRYSERLRDNGLRTVIFLRLAFYLFPPVNWMIGLSRIRGRDYFFGTLIGTLPGTVLYTVIGDGFVPWLLSQSPAVIAAIIITAVCAFGFFFILHLRSIRRKSSLAKDDKTGGGDFVSKPPLLREGPNPVAFSFFLKTIWTYLRLSCRAFFPPYPYKRPPGLKRLAMLLIVLPAFGLLQLIHWLAFWVDELLFPDYRNTVPEKPLFIVGIPRSGTTFLHRVLARDAKKFSTFELWELLFAPAICERKSLLALIKVDKRLGRPLSRSINWCSQRVTGGLDDVHKLSLREAEEDFLLLMPALACYILVVVFPFAEEIQKLRRFDVALSENDRAQVMAFYRSMLQRHCYVNQSEQILLSKNVSFTPMLKSLSETFPDCRMLVCIRHPREAVASQMSAMKGSWQAFGLKIQPQTFQDRWLELMKDYYKHLSSTLPALAPSRLFSVEMAELRTNTAEVVQAVYDKFGYTITDSFRKELQDITKASRAYQSKHNYALEEYGLDWTEIEDEFAEVWQDLQQALSGGKLRNL